MSFSHALPRLTIAALGVCGTLAMRHAEDARHLAPSAIVVVVTLDERYQEQIGELGCLARCVEVTRAVRDTLRQLLADNHGYARWATEGAPADTLELQWLDPDPPFRYRYSHLAFVMRGPAWLKQQEQKDSVMEEFESFVSRSARLERPDGWAPNAVRLEWAPMLRELLNRPRVQRDVFFTLPLEATANVERTGEVRVVISPTALGTTPDPANAPQFEMHVRVKKDSPADWEYDGVLRLTGCLIRTPQQGYYDCQATVLQIGSRTYEGPQLSVLRGESTIATASIHLAKFQPVAGAQRPITTPLFTP